METQTTEEKRYLLYTDEPREQEVTDKCAQLEEALQRAYQAFLNLKLQGVSLTLTKLLAIAQPEDWVREQIFTASPELQRLPFERSAAKAMILLPASFPVFRDALFHAQNLHRGNRIGVPLSLFEIDADGAVVATERLAHWIDAKCTTYTDTEEEVALYEELNSIFERLTAIKEKYPQLQLLGSNTSGALLDDYFGVVKFRARRIKAINQQ